MSSGNQFEVKIGDINQNIIIGDGIKVFRTGNIRLSEVCDSHTSFLG